MHSLFENSKFAAETAALCCGTSSTRLLPPVRKASLPRLPCVTLLLFVSAGLLTTCSEYDYPSKFDPATLAANCRMVESIPGLVAFWTFGESQGHAKESTGTALKHPLKEYGTILREHGGPYSGYHVHLNGKQFLGIDHKLLGDLDIAGKDAQVSMFAVVKMDDMSHGVSVAGIWNEGRGEGDDTGTRQYALLLNMPLYGGPKNLTPMVSSEGGVTHRADGSGMPWCVDYASNVTQVPEHEWVTLGFTYDGQYIRAYYNGVMEARQMDPVKDNRNDPYFTKEGPNGGPRGMNPYFHGKGIFKYDAARDSRTKIHPSPFLVGARYAVGSMLGEAMKGSLSGLAVFNRALTDTEMRQLHASAHLESSN